MCLLRPMSAALVRTMVRTATTKLPTRPLQAHTEPSNRSRSAGAHINCGIRPRRRNALSRIRQRPFVWIRQRPFVRIHPPDAPKELRVRQHRLGGLASRVLDMLSLYVRHRQSLAMNWRWSLLLSARFSTEAGSPAVAGNPAAHSRPVAAHSRQPAAHSRPVAARSHQPAARSHQPAAHSHRHHLQTCQPGT